MTTQTPMPGAPAALTADGCACAAGHAPCRGPESVIRAAVALLDQCSAFIRDLPDPVYTAESRTLKGGTIGKHIRHLVDHYEAILVGVEADAVIDYDHREREVPMESRRAAALENVERARRRLAELAGPRLDGPARIRVMLAADGAETELHTTIAREVAFATHHAVHHHAMIKAIAEEHGVSPAPEFGRAPSTLHHERQPPPAPGQPAR